MRTESTSPETDVSMETILHDSKTFQHVEFPSEEQARKDVSLELDPTPRTEMLRVFDTIEVRGHGMVSLAELEQFILEKRPEWYDETAISLAFKAAEHKDSEGFIRRTDFPFVLLYIVYFQHFLVRYTTEDDCGAPCLPEGEFVLACISVRMPNIDLAHETLRKTETGRILFRDFCAYCAKRRLEIKGTEAASADHES